MCINAAIFFVAVEDVCYIRNVAIKEVLLTYYRRDVCHVRFRLTLNTVNDKRWFLLGK